VKDLDEAPRKSAAAPRSHPSVLTSGSPVAPEPRWWEVSLYSFGRRTFRALSGPKAIYAAFKALNEAGYYKSGRGEFWRFLAVESPRSWLADDQGDPRTPEFGVGR